MFRKFLCAKTDLPGENESVDCVCLIPFCLARSQPLTPSSQFLEVLRAGMKLFYRYTAKYIHTDGGHPNPKTIQTEGSVARKFLLANLVGEARQIVSENESWDTGDNAWHFRRSLKEYHWESVILVVVAEQSQRALEDFQEYLSERNVGWPVRIYVMPVEVSEWDDNIKFALRSRWRFMLYEVLKLALRKSGFTFMYRHKPSD